MEAEHGSKQGYWLENQARLGRRLSFVNCLVLSFHSLNPKATSRRLPAWLQLVHGRKLVNRKPKITFRMGVG
jgi:hypothetical protein